MSSSSSVVVYHGHGPQHATDVDSPVWFTSERKHAAYFGEVHRYRIDTTGMTVVDARTEPQLVDADEPDVALVALSSALAADGYSVVAIDGWEGGGRCYLVLDPSAVERLD